MTANLPNNGSRGFILLDALIAMAIMGPAIGIFLTVAANTATRSIATDDEAEMLSRARDALNVATASSNGSAGVREYADARLRWTVELSSLPDSGIDKIDTLRPLRVAVTVHRDGRRDQRLVSMVLVPGSP